MSIENIRWETGEHADLIASIRGKGLDAPRPVHWRWDPRPTRASNAKKPLPTAGDDKVECPFLKATAPLFEAHAEWVVDEITWHLLLFPATMGGLRWAWHAAPNPLRAPGSSRP